MGACRKVDSRRRVRPMDNISMNEATAAEVIADGLATLEDYSAFPTEQVLFSNLNSLSKGSSKTGSAKYLLWNQLPMKIQIRLHFNYYEAYRTLYYLQIPCLSQLDPPIITVPIARLSILCILKS